jgi:hypothetical protein
MVRRKRRSAISAWVMAGMLSLSTAPALGQYSNGASGGTAGWMIADLLLARPAGIVATAVGTVFFVVSLPFTVPTGSVEAAADQLVVKPAQYTFARPLGQLSH